MKTTVVACVLLLLGACKGDSKEPAAKAEKPAAANPDTPKPSAPIKAKVVATPVKDVVDLSDGMKCVNIAEMRMAGATVYTSQEELAKLPVGSGPECKDWKVPEIDFGKRVVFGAVGSGGCNIVESKHEVTMSDKGLLYTFSVKDEGDCERLAMKANWVSVPKPAEGTKITAKVMN